MLFFSFASLFSRLLFAFRIIFPTLFSSSLYSSLPSPFLTLFHILFFFLIPLSISCVSHGGLFLFLLLLLGTFFSVVSSSFFFSSSHASFTVFPSMVLLQSSLPISLLIWFQSAFFQSLYSFPSSSSDLFSTPISISIITWSLLPSLPSSSRLSTSSGEFVMTRSSVFPFVCVANSTSCVIMFSSVAVINSCGFLPVAVPLCQSIFG